MKLKSIFVDKMMPPTNCSCKIVKELIWDVLFEIVLDTEVGNKTLTVIVKIVAVLLMLPINAFPQLYGHRQVPATQTPQEMFKVYEGVR